MTRHRDAGRTDALKSWFPVRLSEQNSEVQPGPNRKRKTEADQGLSHGVLTMSRLGVHRRGIRGLALQLAISELLPSCQAVLPLPFVGVARHFPRRAASRLDSERVGN